MQDHDKESEQPMKDITPKAEDVQQTTAIVPVAPVLTDAEVTWRFEERKALTMSKAVGFLPDHFRGQPGSIIACWALADALQIPRMAMMQGAFVIKGKVTLSGDLMLAVARANGCKVRETLHVTEVEEGPDGPVAPSDGTYARCEVELPSGEKVTADFSVGDAMQAGLWESNDVWRKYPHRMLKMRARGFAMRDAIPDKLAGVYAEGELDG